MFKKISVKREEGQTMAEFALVLPILALLLFAVLQFGVLFNNYLTVTDAARAGARKGAVGRHLPNPGASVDEAVRASAENLDQGKLSVSVSSSWQQGDPVTVSVSYPYSISLIGIIVSSGNVTSTTTERVE